MNDQIRNTTPTVHVLSLNMWRTESGVIDTPEMDNDINALITREQNEAIQNKVDFCLLLKTDIVINNEIVIITLTWGEPDYSDETGGEH